MKNKGNTITFAIELKSYNVEEAAVSIAKELIAKKPGLQKREYAKMLGISERTFYRWIVKYCIKIEKL